MKHRSFTRGFTIIELLVVVSIIALLIGILLPAIGKARDNAKMTQSQSNIKQVGTACVSYGAEFNDRQVTWLDDNFSTYGSDFQTAFFNPGHSGGEWPEYIHLAHCIGQDNALIINYWGAQPWRYEPINFGTSNQAIGTFRLWNCRPLNSYVNGRVYDPTFFAPKDTVVLAAVEPAFDDAGEWVDLGQDSSGLTKFIYSSYCFSAAAMYSPSVFSRNTNNKYFTDPYTLPSGFKSPAAGQAQYASQKTWIMEHNWLQQRRNSLCNPAMSSVSMDCEPYYFNAAATSSPVAFFFDGHIAPAGVGDAETASVRVKNQTAGSMQHGLWSEDTPLNGTQIGDYFLEVNYEPWTQTCFHVLTIDGIKGRDFIR